MAREKKYTTITIGLPKSLLNLLDEIARSRGTTRSQIVVEAIGKYVEEVGRRAEEKLGEGVPSPTFVPMGVHYLCPECNAKLGELVRLVLPNERARTFAKFDDVLVPYKSLRRIVVRCRNCGAYIASDFHVERGGEVEEEVYKRVVERVVEELLTKAGLKRLALGTLEAPVELNVDLVAKALKELGEPAVNAKAYLYKFVRDFKECIVGVNNVNYWFNATCLGRRWRKVLGVRVYKV